MRINNLVYKEVMAKPDLEGPSETTLSVKVPEGMVRQLDAIAAKTLRKRSSVARMLIMRGFRLYEIDGELLDIPITLVNTPVHGDGILNVDAEQKKQTLKRKVK